MPILARVGPHGVRVGPRLGSSNDGVSDPMAGVSRDATSLIYCPASSAEWLTTLAAAGLSSAFAPSSLYLLQEAAGNPADSIAARTLTRTGVVTYQDPTTGWSRLGIAWADGGNATLLNADASLPDVSTTSHMLLAYVDMPTAAPGVARAFGGVGTTMTAARISTTPRVQVVAGATANGIANPVNAARPLLIQVNRTAGTATVSTDQEEVSTVNLTGVTGQRIGWGGVGVLTPNMTLMYLASFEGAAAEMSTAQKRALLQRLGYTVAF